MHLFYPTGFDGHEENRFRTRHNSNACRSVRERALVQKIEQSQFAGAKHRCTLFERQMSLNFITFMRVSNVQMSYFVNMQVNHFRPYKLTLDRLAELDIEFKGSNEEEREWLMDSVISSVTRSQAAYPEWKKLLSLGSHVTTIPTL